MFIRRDATSGWITVIVGVGAAVFGAVALIFVGIHREFLNTMATHPNGPDDDFLIGANAGYAHVFKFVPWMLLGGIILAIAGYYVRLGSAFWRRVAQLVCVSSFVWLLAVLIDGYHIFPLISPRFFQDQPSFATAFKWICIIGNGLIYSSFPLFLLFVLHCPRPRSERRPTHSQEQLRDGA